MKRTRGYEETEELPFEEPVQRTRGYETDEIPVREPMPEDDGIQSIHGVPLPQSPPMLDLSDTPSKATKRRRDRRRKAMERRSAREAELLDTNGPPVERPAMGDDGAQSINEEAIIPPTPPLCDRRDTLEPEIQGTEYFKRVGEKVYEKHKARLAEMEKRGKSASGAERLQSVFENFSDVIFDKVFKKLEKKLDDVVFETILRANKDGYRIDSLEAARPFVRREITEVVFPSLVYKMQKKMSGNDIDGLGWLDRNGLLASR
ncbi:hypothetical protein IWZ00DRAFT_512318 [Phyllosticta capitalensis]